MQLLDQMKEHLLSHNVCWYLTERCHLSCSFCYAFKGRSQPSAQELFAVGDALVKHGVNSINLAGGEPLLNAAVIPVINRYTVHTKLSLTTSLSLPIKDQLVGALQKLDRVCVSIDTVDSECGIQIRGENYSLPLVMRNIQALRSADANLNFNTVVGRHNIDHLTEIGNYIASLNLPTVWRLFQMTANHNSKNLNTSWLISEARISNTLDGLRAHLKSTSVKVDALYSQALNSKYLIVLPNGDMCHPLVNEYKPIGSVMDKSISEIISQIQTPC